MFGVKSITMINKILMLKLNDIGSGKYYTKYVKHNNFGALPVILQWYWKKYLKRPFNVNLITITNSSLVGQIFQGSYNTRPLSLYIQSLESWFSQYSNLFCIPFWTGHGS